LRCLEQFDRREQKRRSFFGVSPAEAQDRYSEVAEIVLKAMETTTLMYRGRQFSISDVPITLSPIQKPYPPLWFGTTKPDTSRWAAENSINIACVGRSNAIRAYPLGACSAAPAYARWFKTFTLLSRISNLPPPPNLPESFEQALDGGFYLVGSPSTVRETLKSQVVEAGVTYVMCQLAFGDLPLAASLQTISAMRSTIIPDFTSSNNLHVQ
jgi:alkanesulfonate monooxygenase SsuD/methylene tetrahydromethanopterin reductase-like flavin-dependent oxidoreductase (luciferase family)